MIRLQKFVHFFLLAVITPLVLSNCAQPGVIQFLNDNLDFSNYETYRLINYKSADKSFSKDGMIIFTGLESAIDSNMVNRNYRLAEKPDIIVRYEIISSIETESSGPYYDPYLQNRYYYSPPPSYNNTKKLAQGILLIEFRDKKKKKLIWQGSLDLKFSKKTTPLEVVTLAVERIFTTYPYVSGSNEKVDLTEK